MYKKRAENQQNRRGNNKINTAKNGIILWAELRRKHIETKNKNLTKIKIKAKKKRKQKLKMKKVKQIYKDYFRSFFCALICLQLIFLFSLLFLYSFMLVQESILTYKARELKD